MINSNEAKAALDTAFIEGKTEGRIEGKIEGKTEGKIEEKIEVAKTMLAEGFEITVIAKITKLPPDEIEKLPQKNR